MSTRITFVYGFKLRKCWDLVMSSWCPFCMYCIYGNPRQLRGVSDERDEVIAQDWKRVEQALKLPWGKSVSRGGGLG